MRPVTGVLQVLEIIQSLSILRKLIKSFKSFGNRYKLAWVMDLCPANFPGVKYRLLIIADKILIQCSRIGSLFDVIKMSSPTPVLSCYFLENWLLQHESILSKYSAQTLKPSSLFSCLSVNLS